MDLFVEFKVKLQGISIYEKFVEQTTLQMAQELTTFIQREGLFMYSEQPVTGIYPVPDELITKAKVYFL
jgi:hypothetical protein